VYSKEGKIEDTRLGNVHMVEGRCDEGEALRMGEKKFVVGDIK